MKILFVCENYLPHYGGAEVVFKNLAERYVKEGHEVVLVTHRLPETRKEEIIGGIKVIRINCLNSRYWFSFLAIPKVLELAKWADVIQTTTFNGAPPAWVASLIRRKPVVLTVHEVWINKWRQVTRYPWWKCAVHNLLERCIYFLHYDKYVCVSHATKNDLIKVVNKKKIEVIHNGFDYNFWQPENFKKINLGEGFVCFAWGRPGPTKGFDVLIKAFPLIRRRIKSAKLILMFGSVYKYQNEYQQLKKLVRKLGLETDVQIIDSVPYEKLGNYIKSADCVIIPSKAEGFGYAALEALAVNDKVVVSDAGSLPEVVTGEFQMFKNGDSKDLAKKVILISLGEYISTSKKKFDWSESVRKYLEIYSSLS